MKEITRIHLAKTPYNIEVGAKKELEEYLRAIQASFDADDDAMREIEARMVELLEERGVISEQVITGDDAVALKRHLGEASEFSDGKDTSSSEVQNESIRRQLMRVTERGMLGGIVAGIAEYTGWSLALLRMTALVLIPVTGGLVVWLYIILWVVLPPVRTAADYLQLRGERVTISSLQKVSLESVDRSGGGVKPLVMILRIFLVVGFGLGALLALVATIGVATAAGATFYSEIGSFESSASWLAGALMLAVMSGLLFATLMLLAAYASAVWRLTKRVSLILLAVILAGAITFTGAIGSGVYGLGRVQSEVSRLRTSETIPLDNLSGLKGIVVSSQMQVRYVVSPGSPRAELRYLKGNTKPVVELEAKEGQGNLTVHTQGECLVQLFTACTSQDAVTIYGPEIEQVTVKEGYLAYSSGQAVLTAVTEGEASVDIVRGSKLSKLVVRASGNSSVGGVAAIELADVELTDTATVVLGNVRKLALTIPTTCDQDVMVRVEVGEVETATVNGEPVKELGSQVCMEIQGQYSNELEGVTMHEG